MDKIQTTRSIDLYDGATGQINKLCRRHDTHLDVCYWIFLIDAIAKLSNDAIRTCMTPTTKYFRIYIQYISGPARCMHDLRLDPSGHISQISTCMHALHCSFLKIKSNL